MRATPDAEPSGFGLVESDLPLGSFQPRPRPGSVPDPLPQVFRGFQATLRPGELLQLALEGCVIEAGRALGEMLGELLGLVRTELSIDVAFYLPKNLFTRDLRQGPAP